MKKLFISIIASIIALGAHAQVQCEDTCRHVHGIDLSHYQGNVFWETVGDNSKMAYVYLKATEEEPTSTANTRRISTWLIAME